MFKLWFYFICLLYYCRTHNCGNFIRNGTSEQQSGKSSYNDIYKLFLKWKASVLLQKSWKLYRTFHISAPKRKCSHISLSYKCKRFVLFLWRNNRYIKRNRLPYWKGKKYVIVGKAVAEKYNWLNFIWLLLHIQRRNFIWWCGISYTG